MDAADFPSLNLIGSHHFTLSTFVTFAATGGGEWGNGTEDIDVFNPPADFSWTEWFDTAQAVGCKAAVLTAKHVDGFNMWVGDATPTRNIAATAWYAAHGQRDLFREFCDMARSRNMRVGVYFCVLDAWLKLQTGAYNASFISQTQSQLIELFTGYGTFDFAILDGWGSFWPGNGGGPSFVDIPIASIKNLIHLLQPGCLCLINNHESSQGGISVGDVSLYEGITDNEPASGLDAGGNVRCFWRPVRRGSGAKYTEWFTHSDSVIETLQPAVRNAAYTQTRMLARGWPNIINFNYGPDGRMMESEKAIVLGIGRLQIPAIARQLTSSWKLDELAASDTAKDYVNLNDLSVVANPGVAISGKGGQRSFNGSTQKVYFPYSSTHNDLEIGARSATFAALVKTPASYSAKTAIVAKDTGSDGGLSYIIESQADGSVTWRLSPDGTLANKVELNSVSSLSANAVHLIVAVYDRPNAQMRLYIDGNSPVTVAYTAGTVKIRGASGAPFTLGARGGDADIFEPWAGSLIDVSYWQDYAATTADVAYLWNSGRYRSPQFYPSATVDIQNDLVLRYPMTTLDYGGRMPDSSLNGFDGTIAGSYAFVDTTKGVAIDFQDSTANIQRTATSALLMSTPMSVFLWVKCRTVPILATYVCKAKAVSPWNGWFLRENSGVSATITVGVTDYVAFAPGGSLTAGVWAHIGFTYDGETLICYRDGIAGTPNTTPSGNIASDSQALMVGNDPGFSARKCDAVMSDLRIFNRALTAAEVGRIMRPTRAGKNGVLLGIPLSI